MIDVERYKKLYGGGEEFAMEGCTMTLPNWFVQLALQHTGLKSRKKRHVRKRLKSFLFECIERGIT